MKLVLEGGGVRAAYASGVIHSLAHAGVVPDAVIGSSSGALNAAFTAAGQIDVAIEMWRTVIPGNRMINWRRQFTPWGKPGLDVDWIVDEALADRLDLDRATSGKTHLYFTATDVDARAAVVARPTRDNLLTWLRAALALPVGYNRIVTVDGKRFIDGGIGSPVPFDEPLGEDYPGPTVVVLTRPMQTRKPPPALWERVALKLIVPPGARELSETQHHHHNSLMGRLSKAVERGEVVLVEPPPDLPLSRLTQSKEKIQRGVELGQRVGERLARQLGA